MGTRQLQKLQGKDLLLGQDEDDSDELQSGDEGNAAPAFNPFLLLGDEEDEPVSEDEGEGEGETQHEASAKPEQPSSRSRSKNKKQKKSKQGRKGKDEAESAHDVDIDAALKDLGLDAVPSPAPAPQTLDRRQTFTFDINTKLLSPDEVLALESRERRAPAGPARRGQPQHSRQRLLSQHADLPPYDGSLAMSSIAPGPGSTSTFRIEPSSRYRTATLHFEQAQRDGMNLSAQSSSVLPHHHTHQRLQSLGVPVKAATGPASLAADTPAAATSTTLSVSATPSVSITASMDPNNIAAVLAEFPFHVHSVITMSDVYQTSGQGDSAGAMLNRALYALEGAWHPGFKACLLRGTARLPAKEGENGLMFAALARRVRALCRQGMHRTALEWAKLTVRLDDTDPAGLLLIMDYLALRAREYDFIDGLVEAWDGPASLRLVPSYAFSAALAAYYAGKGAPGEQGTATGVHEAGARPELDVQLVNAIVTFPLAIEHLVKAMQDKDAAKSANWQSIMRRPLFAEPRGAASATLQHLCRIFAARHDELWKAPDVLAWLLRCAEAAADAADASAAGTAAPQVHPSQVPVADAHTLIGLTYPESQENEYAHCVVSDYTDTVAAVPPEQMAAMGAAGGEVPAELEQMAEAYARNFIQQSGMRQLSDEELQAANPVMALLQTLMPWVRVAGEAAEAEGQTEDDLLPQMPGLTAFLAERGIDMTRAVPPDDRPRILELVREFLIQRRGGGQPPE